jgi:hypothetical protein
VEDFLKKSVMKVSGMAIPQLLKGPCSIHVQKRNDIHKNLIQVIPQNRKQLWENIPIHNY